ncbi:inverse autotransporter beta domain-containing protein [Escherichia fergusonii]|uniref:inverse autotransporter beta domain-containing protein n=1 Tax=Escherichia fergusonii TaxID=564 RepID=UPI0015F38517|nr:inverse autotransporter beta domain-containing protein [Escherichia fergusonii]MBA8500454.1 inverse autotransporter beta domain-containing protein [Escherichia fergusonii]
MAVPASAPVRAPEPVFAPVTDTTAGNDNGRLAGLAVQAGGMLNSGLSGDQAAGMARTWATGVASSSLQEWLSQWGTARVTLGTDEHFSLKGSGLDLLLPWYDDGNTLVFSQHSFHRTDDRNQLNTGLGWRHFTPGYMTGVNLFYDHDLTRYHSRLGLGAEYWRDYLKLGVNGYLRLSNWRSAPELDHDYEARPANGWDLRAEGYLPACPQLGAKLMYEQYYGDEVALFGRDERQRNPYAVTAGLSYTPVPMVSFSAEQKQGKGGENDTRFGVDLTYMPGVSLSAQLDPDAVATRRSLAGSRQDLVERNNNIILEYRKKVLVKLTLSDPVRGKPGEEKLLVSSLQSKYALKQLMVEAGTLTAAGGTVRTEGSQVTVTLPAYRYTTTAETDNSYRVAVTAEDVKGNRSARAESMVVVEAPEVDPSRSLLTVEPGVLTADGESTASVTFTAKDSSDSAVPGLPVKLVLSGAAAEGVQVTAVKEQKDGQYTATLTAGRQTGEVSLQAQVNGKPVVKEAATVSLVAADADAAHSDITLTTENVRGLRSGSRWHAGERVQVTVTLRDRQGRAVNGQLAALTAESVKVPGMESGTAWKEAGEGRYVNPHAAVRAGENLKAELKLAGWKAPVNSAVYHISADELSPADSAVTVMPERIVADGGTPTTVTYTAKDAHDNPVSGLALTLSVSGVTGTSFSGFTDEGNGLYRGTLTGTESGTANLMPQVNGTDAAQAAVSLTLTAGAVDPDVSELSASPSEIVADGEEKATLTLTLKDGHNNPVTVDDGISIAQTGTPLADLTVDTVDYSQKESGVYTVTVHGTRAGQATLQAGAAGVTVTQTVTLTLTAGAVDPDVSELSASPSEIVADGEEKATLTLTLKDGHNNPVTVDDGISIAQTGTPLADLTVDTVDYSQKESGVYTVTVHGTRAGQATLQAGAAGVTVTQTVTLTLTAGQADQTESAISTDSDSYIVGEEMALTVTLKDKQKNPVAGMEDVLQDSVIVPNASLQGNWGTGDNPGEYTATYTAGNAGDNLKATLKLTGWSGPQASDVYRIAPPLEPMSGTITANGKTNFSTTATTKFPTTGFKSAYFKLNEDNFSEGISNYTLTASCGGDADSCNWVGVEDDGTVKFTAAATTSTKTVTLTATPKAKRKGQVLFYKFTVGKWFSRNENTEFMTWQEARDSCGAQGSELPSLADVTGLKPDVSPPVDLERLTGTMAGEWGVVRHFSELSYIRDYSHMVDEVKVGVYPGHAVLLFFSMSDHGTSVTLFVDKVLPDVALVSFCGHSI